MGTGGAAAGVGRTRHLNRHRLEYASAAAAEDQSSRRRSNQGDINCNICFNFLHEVHITSIHNTYEYCPGGFSRHTTRLVAVWLNLYEDKQTINCIVDVL